MNRLLSAFTGAIMLLGMGSTASAAEVVEWQTDPPLPKCGEEREVCIHNFGNSLYEVKVTCFHEELIEKGTSRGYYSLDDPSIWNFEVIIDEPYYGPPPYVICGVVFNKDGASSIDAFCDLDYTEEAWVKIDVKLKPEGSEDCPPDL